MLKFILLQLNAMKYVQSSSIPNATVQKECCPEIYYTWTYELPMF
jgi:hypothetical protein